MNSPTIIDIPPRIIRPLVSKPAIGVPLNQKSFGGEDELRELAHQIVDLDPALAFLLARAGERVRKS